MLRRPQRKSVRVGLASLLKAVPFSPCKISPIQKRASRPSPTRLRLELLEDRVLLSASISGTVFNSLAGQTSLAGQVVYLNTPGGTFTTTAADASPTIDGSKLPGQLFGITPGTGSVFAVQNAPSKIVDLAVTIDLSLDSNASGPVAVSVISPTGLTVPDLPLLFHIQPGEHFVGTFDGNNTTSDFSLAQQQNSTVTGTFRPQQYFTDSQAFIYDGNPNGTWGLVFNGAKNTDPKKPPLTDDLAKVHLNSWSLTFTAPNPNAVTDIHGNYTFAGLQPGTYTVSAADSAADVANPGPQSVTLADGQTAAVNFGVQPAPDLTGVAFNIVGMTTVKGQKYDKVEYTLTNQGNGDAQPFNVDVVLSTDGVIRDNVAPLITIARPGFAAHASKSDSVLVPVDANTPADAYIGFLIHSPQGQAESSTTNNSNQGAGVDLALLGANRNQDLTDAGVQQQPSIAVDPNDPNHIVVAYMDYSLLATGYAGIGVRYSSDGGANWTTNSVALPTGFDQGAAQPTVHFDNNGRVYLSFAAATFLGALPGLTTPSSSQRKDGFTSNNGVFVVSGLFVGDSLSLSSPTAVTENFYTGTTVPFDVIPDFAVDAFAKLPDGTVNPNYGNLYVTWARFYPKGQFPGDAASTNGSDIMIAVSKDGGLTWTTQTQNQGGVAVSVVRDPKFGTGDRGAAGSGSATFPHVTIGPEGDVYVAGYTGGIFSVFHSTNAAASFTSPDYTNQLGLPFGGGVHTLPNGTLSVTNEASPDKFRTLAVRDIVADPTHPGRI
jgi:hypothetical protein